MKKAKAERKKGERIGLGQQNGCWNCSRAVRECWGHDEWYCNLDRDKPPRPKGGCDDMPARDRWHSWMYANEVAPYWICDDWRQSKRWFVVAHKAWAGRHKEASGVKKAPPQAV
jgi:hypothetical protein